MDAHAWELGPHAVAPGKRIRSSITDAGWAEAWANWGWQVKSQLRRRDRQHDADDVLNDWVFRLRLGNGITDAGWAEIWASIETMSDEEAEGVRAMVEELASRTISDSSCREGQLLATMPFPEYRIQDYHRYL